MTWRRLRTAPCGSVAGSRGLRDVSIRRPATSREFHLAAAPRRTASSSARMAMPGSPKADRTQSCGSMPRPKTSSCFRCPRLLRTPVSIRSPSTARVSCGSPATMESTDAPIPHSGKVEAWKAPRGSGPYGMTGTPSGDIWYASLAGDYIARIDATAAKVTVIDPPSKGVGPRRIWSDSKGMLWVSFWNAGAIGRYDPTAKKWAVFPLPHSKSGAYSIYVDDKDRVWTSDWPANAIQRFDPNTATYTTFPSNKKGADVRQMLGRPGEVWGGESGTDRLVVIRD